MPSAAAAPDDARPARHARNPPWLFQAAVVVAVLLVNVFQQVGRITFDTKLDLQIDPGNFMARSMHLWNPDAALGELQNQASGYLFPMGPYYWLGELLHVPTWLWQRLFTALLMLLAYEGMRRLARAWGGDNTRIGTWAAVLAGLSYMLAPRLLSTVGALAGEALATSILPWTVLPLVLWLRGRVTPVRATILSAATIPFMGGQNATEVLAALTLPAVLLVVNRVPWRRRILTFVTWAGLAVVVCLWWLLPLLVLGKYGAPFLNYIEAARTTTDQIGWLSAFRGTDHWVTFLAPGDSSSWAAGYELSARPYLLVATSLVAAVGLLGLLSRRLANRGALVIALLLAMFALTAGSGGVAGSWLDPVWTEALDGVLAPFRNVHKFDPVVRVVLALGVAAAFDTALAWRPRISRRDRSRTSRLVPVLAACAMTVPVLVGGAPAFSGQLRDDSGFDQISDSWTEAADFLNQQDGPVRALVMPGAGFAIQTWGRTIDEPLQVLDTPPWVSRTQTPLIPPGAIRMLDGIENALVKGRPEPQLAAMLGRIGITHIVMRNDLDYRHVDSPRPEFIHRVLDGAPGLLQVANFGTSETIYPAIEIYAVASPATDPRVHLFNADEAVTVSGGAEAMRSLLTSQQVDWNKPMLRVTDPDEIADVVTDSLRRVERNFGRVHFATSDVMTGSADFRNQRAAHDYDYPDDTSKSSFRYSGIADVLASSAKGYADTSGPVEPEHGPYAAVDGSFLTSWITAPFADPLGSWIELRFDEPTVIGPWSLHFDLENGAGVRKVRIETEDGIRAFPVDLNGEVTSEAIETAPTDWMRITVTDSNRSIRPVTLNEIAIEGLVIDRTLVAPGRVGAASSMALEGTTQRPACIAFYGGLNCDLDNQRLTTDTGGWEREVRVDANANFLISGTVVAAGGVDVASLMAPLDPRQVTASATSWYGGDPAVIPQNAVDGEPSTTWVADPADERPVLDLRWQNPHRITRILPVLAPGTPAVLPGALRIKTDQGVQRISLSQLGAGIIEPVKTTTLRVTLIRSQLESDTLMPMGMSELEVKGIGGLKYHAESELATGRICGFGPNIYVGDTRIRTQIQGTVGDLISGAALRLTGCAQGAAGADLTPGDHVIRVENVPGFEVRDLSLTPGFPSLGEEPDSTAVVEAWGSSQRRIQVQIGDVAALLGVNQALNQGWRATLDGKTLKPIEIDGWMQGWELPAGASGDMVLSFTPQTPYLVGLMVGLVLAGLIVLLAVLLLVQRWRGGPTATTIVETSSSRRVRWWQLLALTAMLTVVSLPAVAGALVAMMFGWLPRWIWGVVLAAMIGAAIAIGAVGLRELLSSPESSNVLIAATVGAVVVLAMTGLGRAKGVDHG